MDKPNVLNQFSEVTAVFNRYPQPIQDKLWELRALILETAVSTLHTFLHNCLKEKNKFVRAWAYNGFYELARQHSQFQTECKKLLATATQEEAASIKARIRKIYQTDAKSSSPFL